MEQKKAAPTEANATIKTGMNHTAAVNPPTVKPLSPRERRLVDAIARGWASREHCDRAVGTTNSPDYVMRLRKRLGGDAVQMRMVDAVDRDGRACRFGQYKLSPEGLQRLHALGLMDGTRGG